jgi:L-threonylcarbamoyladenylate synthase
VFSNKTFPGRRPPGSPDALTRTVAPLNPWRQAPSLFLRIRSNVNEPKPARTPHRTERLQQDRAGVERAAAILRAGGTVAFPTETVYGLGADATRAEAVARIYAAKARPRFNPLIAHVTSLEAAKQQGVFNRDALTLAQAFWPGPLTLVLPAANGCSICDLSRAGLGTVALRVPAHPLALGLLEALSRPVAAPSANRSGRVSPTSASHVIADLDGRIDAVLDGGPAAVGIESTIVACLDSRPFLLRPGGLPRAALEAVIGGELAADGDRASPLAPGGLLSHYAPRARVRLQASAVRPGEAALLFGSARPEGLERARMVLNLSERGDPTEAAAHLFSYLRRLDDSGAASIAVSEIPEVGLGEAINDRLRRAAA